MFSGTYIHSLDSKNRLIIPSKIRDKIDTSRDGNGFYVTYGFDNCLFVYTPEQWKETLGKLRSIPLTNKRGRDVLRVLAANSHEITCDSHGRILLPETHRKAVGINKEVALIGVIDRIEIWDYETWTKRKTEVMEDFDNLADGLL